MNEQKKYLSKKRKKIFFIKKSANKKKNYNKSKEIQHQSLINISKLVLDFIKQNNKTTGNQIIENIMTTLKADNEDEMIQKNIQRRVYDAINVMSSIGLIRKNRQNIEYINYNSRKKKINFKKYIDESSTIIITNDSQKEQKENKYENKDDEIVNFNLNYNKNENLEEVEEEDEEEDDKIEEEYNEKLKKKKELQKNLIKKYITLKFHEKYSKIKKEAEKEKEKKNKVKFPFEVIKYKKGSPIAIQAKEDFSEYKIVSNSEFKYLNTYDIMKKIMAPELLNKLNNCKNKKCNIKKSLNGECFFDNNVNNKTKNLKTKNINIIESKDKNDKIFNYLKKCKLFKEELLAVNEENEK